MHEPVDLTNASFDDFVRFLFERDIPDKSEKRRPWYFATELHEIHFSADRICGYYVQLFRQPEFLLSRFTKAQLEEGFWAIMGPNLDFSAYRMIRDSELPMLARKDCIDS